MVAGGPRARTLRAETSTGDHRGPLISTPFLSLEHLFLEHPCDALRSRQQPVVMISAVYRMSKIDEM